MATPFVAGLAVMLTGFRLQLALSVVSLYSVMGIEALEFDEQLGAFRWEEAAPDARSRFVLLGEDYAQIEVVDAIGPSPWKPTAAQSAGWPRAQTVHGFVLSVVNDRTVKSPMIRFVWQ